MFKTFSQKGFQVSFDNGLTVSVMFGSGNYCEHRFSDIEPGDTHDSASAEIAVIDSNGNFVTEFPGCPEGDKVGGWVGPGYMLEVMNWAAAQ
jgi:hypothetical protein